MDLLYTKNYDAFVIVCSDADYTPLAIRLRETGAYIFGVGEDKTPTAFRNSCDRFILTDHLLYKTESPEEEAEEIKTEAGDAAGRNGAGEAKAKQKDEPGVPKISEIHKLLENASKSYQDDDGWVNASDAGGYIKRARPDFELKAYGFSKLSDLLVKYTHLYETKKSKVKNGTAFLYRLK